MEQLIDLFGGGAQRVEDVPEFIPQWVVKSAFSFLESCSSIRCPYMPDDIEPPRPSIRAALVRSTGLFASVHHSRDNSHLILIPVGLIARTWVLARLLLAHWHNDFNIYHLNSPLDEIDPSKVFVPAKYRPLFGDFENGSAFWEALRSLNSANSADISVFENDAAVMTLHVFYFVVLHELHHVFFRHSEALGEFARRYDSDWLTSFRRGLELEADFFASAQLMKELKIGYARDGYQSDQDFWNLFIRYGYGKAMFFGLMDANRKYIHCYRDGVYNHPAVRHIISVKAITQWLSRESRGDALVKLWRAAERDGWKRCMFAYNHLTLDIWKEEEPPAGMVHQPVQALMYGGWASAPHLDRLSEVGWTDLRRATEANLEFLRETFRRR